MSNITNNYEPGSCVFEAGSSQNGDVHISAPIYQGGAKPSGGTAKNTGGDEENPEQLSNRQVVIMMTALMDISLSPDYTNQKQLARLLSQLTGRSAESLRKTIGKVAKEGIETDEARKDAHAAADALEPFCKRISDQIRNDAEEM